MKRPTPDPSQEGNRHSSASSPFPSWEGLGVGSWFHCMHLISLRYYKCRSGTILCPCGLGSQWQIGRNWLEML